MAASDISIRQLYSAGLGGRDVIRLGLRAAGYPSFRSFALAHGHIEQAVHQAISGERSNDTTSRILDDVAQALRESREVIDALVAGDELPKHESDAVEVSHGRKVRTA